MGVHGRFSAGLTADQVRTLRAIDQNEETYGVAERVREIVARLLSTEDGQNLASLMAIADAAGHFTAGTLEGVLAELATAGVTWKPAVAVVALLGQKTVAQLDALGTGAAVGDAYIAGDAGTPAQGSSSVAAVGDILEWSGTAWVKIVDNVDNYVPGGTVCIVGGGTLVAPFTDVDDRHKVVTFDGTDNNGSLAVPTKGEARFCTGPGSVRENRGYVYDTTPAGWNDVAGPTLYAQATPAAVGTAAVGTSARLAREDHVHAHGDQGAVAGSLHDADQVDYERADGSKNKIQAGSDTVAAAIDDLDDAMPTDVGTFVAGTADRISNPGGTTETAFAATVTIPAGAFEAGTVIEWDAIVQIAGIANAQTATIRARLGGVGGLELASSEAFDPSDSPDPGEGDAVSLGGRIRCRTAGAGGAVDGQARVVKDVGGTVTDVAQAPLFRESIDLSVAKDLVVTIEFSGSDGANVADLIGLHASVRKI